MGGFSGKIVETFLRTAQKILKEQVAELSCQNRPGNPLCTGTPVSANGGTALDPSHCLSEFLSGQGIRIDRLEGFLLGWVDTPEAMFVRLKEQGFSEEEIRQSKLLADRRVAGRLVGPIQTASRQIVSVWARSISLPAQPPGYLYWKPDWKAKVPVVWLPSALAYGGRKKGLLVVEDILEALMLQSQGFRHTVALGESGQAFLPKRFPQLAQLRISYLVLVLNQTKDALHRLQKIQEGFQKGAWPLRLGILPPQELGPYFSPGEFVQNEGKEALEELLARKILPVGELSPTAPALPPSGKICPLHQCRETECFCFD